MKNNPLIEKENENEKENSVPVNGTRDEQSTKINGHTTEEAINGYNTDIDQVGLKFISCFVSSFLVEAALGSYIFLLIFRPL